MQSYLQEITSVNTLDYSLPCFMLYLCSLSMLGVELVFIESFLLGAIMLAHAFSLSYSNHPCSVMSNLQIRDFDSPVSVSQLLGKRFGAAHTWIIFKKTPFLSKLSFHYLDSSIYIQMLGGMRLKLEIDIVLVVVGVEEGCFVIHDIFSLLPFT